MNRIKKASTVALFAVVAVLGAASAAQASNGGTPIPQDASSKSQPHTGQQLEDAKRLVEAWGSGDPDVALDAAHEYTAPGTAARAYARYLALDFRPYQEAGIPSEAVVRPIDGGWELCPEQDSDAAACAQFNNWEFEGEKISNFLLCERAIDDGRLLGSGKPIRAEDYAVQRLAAFASPFNPVYTVLRVENTSNARVKLPSATYTTSDGESIEATVIGAKTIPAGETRTIEVRAVTPTGLGGTVHLSGDLDVSVPVFGQKQPDAVLASASSGDDAGAREGCCGAQD